MILPVNISKAPSYRTYTQGQRKESIIIPLLRNEELESRTHPSLFSSKMIPLIILVVLPPIFLALPDVADYYGIDVQNDQILWPSILVVIFAIYVLYDSGPSSEKYFTRKNPENLVYEFRLLQKILYCEIAAFLLCLTILVILPLVMPYAPLTAHNYFESRGFVEDDIFFSTMFAIGGTMGKIAILVSRKEFSFYFARGCFRILEKEEDGHENVSYFIAGLNSYNKYLLKNMKLHIEDMKQIYSKFFCAPAREKTEIIKALDDAFAKSKSEPIKPLLHFLGDKKADEFLTKQHFKAKTEHYVGIITPIMAVIFTMMEFWSKISSQFVPPPHP